MEKSYKVYKYRWVVLAAYMLLAIVIQVQWLTHAPVARAAEVFYAGQFNPESLFNIDFIAMSYMLVFLIMCIPASYIIDTFGIKTGLGIGAFLTAFFSLLKGVFGANFTIVLIAQIGLAAAQPFIINAVTAVTVRWFPLRERGMAAGFSALAQYLGIITAMAITPLLVVNSPELADYGKGIDTMLLWYGIITAVTAVAAFFLIREKPPTSPSATEYKHTNFFNGFKYIFKNRSMVITLLLFFIGLGLFNTVSSMVDSIAGFIGVSDSDGLIGVLMLVGGVIGAVVLPILSDKLRKRKIFLVICIMGMLPGIAGLTFAGVITSGVGAAYIVALISSFILGFFVMSAGPIGFQYAAEVSYPAPESSSQGMLLFAGQITGLVFTAAMSVRDNMYLKTVMNIFVVLAVIAAVLVLFLKESPMIITEDDKIREEAGKPDRV
ncbi:MAG: MFS transporter [Bacteroidetes bacterium]|nr:MFS transporter [Bacteroidota bacterium]